MVVFEWVPELKSFSFVKIHTELALELNAETNVAHIRINIRNILNFDCLWSILTRPFSFNIQYQPNDGLFLLPCNLTFVFLKVFPDLVGIAVIPISID